MGCAYGVTPDGHVTDTCSGDSGGPLFIKGATAADDVVYGLTSWGQGCATRGVSARDGFGKALRAVTVLFIGTRETRTYISIFLDFN